VHLLWPTSDTSGVRRHALTVAWVIAFVIAASRVYLGVHYPTDVAAGLLAGTSWLGLSVVAMSRREPRLRGGAPTPAPASAKSAAP
jgi:undecaprenyl-diphosphatase